MTKGLENFFNLPPLDDFMSKMDGVEPKASETDDTDMPNDGDENEFQDETVDKEITVAKQEADRARRQLAMLEGTDHSEAMDVIHRDCVKHASDLIDLAFNVDVKATARLAEVAAAMYKVAIDAKNSKREAQLKSLKLALERQKMGNDRSAANVTTKEIEGEGVIISDRNELIRQALTGKK